MDGSLFATPHRQSPLLVGRDQSVKGRIDTQLAVCDELHLLLHASWLYGCIIPTRGFLRWIGVMSARSLASWSRDASGTVGSPRVTSCFYTAASPLPAWPVDTKPLCLSVVLDWFFTSLFRLFCVFLLSRVFMVMFVLSLNQLNCLLTIQKIEIINYRRIFFRRWEKHLRLYVKDLSTSFSITF